MKEEKKAFVKNLQPKTECSSCDSTEVVIRIGGRNYCSDCRDQGYSRAIFAAMAGDD